MGKVKGERREDLREWERPVEVSGRTLQQLWLLKAGEEARSHQPAWGLASPSASLLSKRPENDPLPRTAGDYMAKSLRMPEDAKSRESVTCGPAGGLDLTLALSIVSILCRSEAPGALSLGPCRNRKQTQKFSKFAK